MKFAALAVAVSLLAGPTSAACVIHLIAELPVTMRGTQPLVEARINGSPARFVVDSGSFFSVISPGAAAQLHLSPTPPPHDIRAEGVGGSAALLLAEVKDFRLADIPVPHADFFVGGSEAGGEAVGVIGQNVLGIGDVEYDLAGGVIRLLRPDHCGAAPLAYWVRPPLSYGMLETRPTTPLDPLTGGAASINGARIRVVFDTGAATSVLSLSAARRAGLTPTSPGVVPAGLTGGFGRRLVRTWIGPVDVFEIGGEKIEHTRLRFGDVQVSDADMFLGADFFLSHRVYVSNSQHKVYFSYNGGPVFNLEVGTGAEAAPSAAVAGAQPTDAAGFARRGAAEAARREFAAAITDFTQAMALDSKAADYPFQRGVARLEAGDRIAAAADFDRTLALAPGDVRALLARANLRLGAHDTKGAIADLDSADKALAPQANERLYLAMLYRRAEAPARALGQYDEWIRIHPDDHNQGQALGGRCWARMLLDEELGKAMSDCQRALSLTQGDSGILEARAFVRLRQGDYDRAIADFDKVLDTRPKAGWSHYGRGLAELKKGMTDSGKADIAATLAIDPAIAKRAAKFSIGP